LVEKIRDSAGQKGTGKWTAIAALDYGVPVTLIGEAVFARCLSSLQAERIEASKVLPAPAFKAYSGERASFIEAIRKVSINFYFCFFLFLLSVINYSILFLFRHCMLQRLSLMLKVLCCYERRPSSMTGHLTTVELH
jgi:hypothetical protein